MQNNRPTFSDAYLKLMELHQARFNEEQEGMQEPPDLLAQLAQMENETRIQQNWEGRPPELGIPQQMAKSVNPLQALGLVAQGNIQNNAMGIQNSLLQAVNRLGGIQPSKSGKALPPNFPEQFQQGIDNKIQGNRNAKALNDDLLRALSDEHPKAAFLANALTFTAEVAVTSALTGRPATTIGRRMGQEAFAGSMFGAMTVGMTDEQKISAVAAGFITGALSPALFGAAGKIFKLEPETAKRVTDMVRLQKLLLKNKVLTYGELTGIRGALKIEAALDNIALPWIGLSGVRDRQLKGNRTNAEWIVEQIMPRAIRGMTPDRIHERLISGLHARFIRQKKAVDAKYDKIAAEADAITGTTKGQAPRTERSQGSYLGSERIENRVALRDSWGKEGEYITAARRLLEEAKEVDFPLQDKQLIGLLEGIVGKDPRYITFSGARRTLAEIEERLRVATSQATRGDATKTGMRLFMQLDQGLKADMRSWASALDPSNRKTIMDMLDDANQLYKDTLVPYYSSEALKEVAYSGPSGFMSKPSNLDDLAARFINPSKPYTSRANMALLDDVDKDIARYMIVREALDRAQAGMTPQTWNPRAFVAELEKLSGVWDVTFSPAQADLLKGFKVVATLSDRAHGKPGAIGALMTTGAAGATAVGGMHKFIGVFGSLVGLKWAFESDAGKIVLHKLAQARNVKELNEAAALGLMSLNRFMEKEMADYAESRPDFYRQNPMGPRLNRR